MELLKEIIVVYDVSENKPRTKLFKALKNIGMRNIQNSVFWGRVNEAEKRSIRRLFNEHLDKETDRAFILETKLSSQIKLTGYGYGDGTQFDEELYYIT
jgi:CRISPR-associated endonuclease Cas2